MRRIGLFCVAAFVLSAAAAWAEESSHDKAARELLRVMRVEEMARGGAEAMVDVMVQTNPQLLPFRDVIGEWSRKVMTWEAMAPGMIDAYKSAFTESEMRKIAEFYGAPAGQKLLEKMPELMQKQAQIGTRIAQAHQDELRSMIEKKAKELEAESKEKKEQ